MAVPMQEQDNHNETSPKNPTQPREVVLSLPSTKSIASSVIAPSEFSHAFPNSPDNLKKRNFISRFLRPQTHAPLSSLPSSTTNLSSSPLITVRTQSGKSLKFALNPETTLASLKAEVREHVEMPLHKMLLIYNSEPLLEEQERLAECGVQAGAVLYLVRFVQEPQGLGGRFKQTEMRQLREGGVYA